LKSFSRSKLAQKEGKKTDRVENQIQSRLKFLKEMNMVSPKVNIWDEFSYPTTLNEIKTSLLHQNPASCDRINALMVKFEANNRVISKIDTIWLLNKIEDRAKKSIPITTSSDAQINTDSMYA
jgi:hypothetical protein